MLQALSFALTVTSPILFMLLLGYAFLRHGMLSEDFIQSGSKLVFNVTLPCLLFLNVSTTDVIALIQAKLLGCAIVIIFLAVILLWLFSGSMAPAQRGVFVQCAFRSNMGVVGLALAVNAFGNGILASAGVYLAFMTIVYNILAVVVLSAAQHQPEHNLALMIGKSIISNPLIIAIVLGLILSLAQLRLPEWLMTSGRYLADMTLPLALLCVGGSLSFGRLRGNRNLLIWATISKLILVPGLATLAGVLIGLRGTDLGILYLMTGAPTAAASFVMSHQMEGDADLAADIIALTTIFTAFSSSAGLVILRSAQLI